MGSRWILLNAANIAKRNPNKFWHPSRSLLARLRRSTEVQLRVVEYDDKEGAELWDNVPIWIRLTKVTSGECTGHVTISEIPAEGFRVGDEIRFTKDRIFDLWETRRNGAPLPNRGKARFVRGKDVIVGLTYLNHDGRLRQQIQFHGTIEAVGLARGIRIRRSKYGDTFTLPPDFRSLQPAPPGTYTLRSTGDVVEDPALEATWTITEPPASRQARGR